MKGKRSLKTGWKRKSIRSEPLRDTHTFHLPRHKHTFPQGLYITEINLILTTQPSSFSASQHAYLYKNTSSFSLVTSLQKLFKGFLRNSWFIQQANRLDLKCTLELFNPHTYILSNTHYTIICKFSTRNSTHTHTQKHLFRKPLPIKFHQDYLTCRVLAESFPYAISVQTYATLRSTLTIRRVYEESQHYEKCLQSLSLQ